MSKRSRSYPYYSGVERLFRLKPFLLIKGSRRQYLKKKIEIFVLVETFTELFIKCLLSRVMVHPVSDLDGITVLTLEHYSVHSTSNSLPNDI